MLLLNSDTPSSIFPIEHYKARISNSENNHEELPFVSASNNEREKISDSIFSDQDDDEDDDNDDDIDDDDEGTSFDSKQSKQYRINNREIIRERQNAKNAEKKI